MRKLRSEKELAAPEACGGCELGRSGGNLEAESECPLTCDVLGSPGS